MRTNATLPTMGVSVDEVKRTREQLLRGKRAFLITAYNNVITRLQDDRDLDKDIVETYNKLEDILDEIEALTEV